MTGVLMMKARGRFETTQRGQPWETEPEMERTCPQDKDRQQPPEAGTEA